MTGAKTVTGEAKKDQDRIGQKQRQEIIISDTLISLFDGIFHIFCVFLTVNYANERKIQTLYLYD